MRPAVLEDSRSPTCAIMGAGGAEPYPWPPAQTASLLRTCSHGLPEEDGVGSKDEQQRQVCGDIVGDGVLQVPFTPEGEEPRRS